MLTEADIPEADRARYYAAAVRYQQALHAVQSGIAFEMQVGDGAFVSPKHMRVGVDSAITSASSLGALLVRKGLLSAAEMMEALAADTEADARRYAERIEQITGRTVELA